jgi:hypothetical protein
MNRLLTILLLLGATAHGQINNPPTSVNIVDSTATGRAVLTATNAAAAATAVGLGTANEVTFNRVQVGGATFTADDFSGGNFAITAGHALTFASGGTPGATLTNLGLGAANNVTFSNITASGTLGVTGNATFSGTANLAPSQTADSGSLMTRDLGDDRYTTSIWLTQFSDNQTITNGGLKLLAPGRFNSWSFGYGASVPSGFTEFRVVLSFGWLQNPATNSTNFPVFVLFNNRSAGNADTKEAEHGTAFSRTDLYPTNAGSTGLAGTLTRRAVFNTTNTVYSFISDWVTIPNAWQSNASSNGFYHVIGAAIANNTGSDITEAITQIMVRSPADPHFASKIMKLLLSNNQLTRYAKSGDYATTTAIPLDGELAVTAQTLLAWLQSQLTEDESVGQVFLEPDGTHSDYETSVDAEGNESQSVTSTRAKLSAAVTAHAAAGSRSVVFSSEALPAELRDGLLAAWAVIEGMP